MTIPAELAAWLGIAPDAPSYTATLAAPIELAGETYQTITWSEPTLDQIEEAVKTPPGIAQDIQMLSIVSKVPASVIRKLPASEYRKAVAYLTFFTGYAPPRGDSS